MTDLQRHVKTGLLYRPEGRDDVIFGERRLYECIEAGPDDVLLDVGGHIGIVSSMFLERGIRYAVAVEPHPETAGILRQNLEQYGDRAVVLEGAVRSEPVETTLYVNAGADLSSHRVVETRGREGLPVATYVLDDLLATYQPTILKVDIEGGEYELADRIAALPEHVRWFALELHVHLRNWRELAPVMIDSVRAQGFKDVREPRLTPKAWGTVGVWQR